MSSGSSRLEKRTARKGIVTIMAIVRYERKPGDPLTRRQKENLKRIAEIKDEDIDFSDIPELTDEWFKLMASILGLSSSPLRLEDVPLGATSPPGAPLAPNGTSPPADI